MPTLKAGETDKMPAGMRRAKVALVPSGTKDVASTIDFNNGRQWQRVILSTSSGSSSMTLTGDDGSMVKCGGPDPVYVTWSA